MAYTFSFLNEMANSRPSSFIKPPLCKPASPSKTNKKLQLLPSSLRFAQMNEKEQLTEALKHLIQGEAEQAISKATPWPETWIAKCIIFLAHSFFNYDPETAMEVFGGREAIDQLMASERVERYFLQGYGALFRKEEERSESAFESAAKILPSDPFIQFSLAFIYMKRAKINKVFDVITLMGQQNAGHPLLYLLRDIVLRQKGA